VAVTLTLQKGEIRIARTLLKFLVANHIQQVMEGKSGIRYRQGIDERYLLKR